MVDDIPSILSHISIGTNDFERAIGFYDKVLPTLGCKRIMEHPDAVACGKQFPDFWVQIPNDGKSATTANGTHLDLKRRWRPGARTTVRLGQGRFTVSRTMVVSCAT